MSEWISVEDELPEDGQNVDLYLYMWDIDGKHGKRLTDCTYYKEHGFLDSNNRVVSKAYYMPITHWMSTPEPLNQGRDE